MRRGGIEPPASPLSAECSATELTARQIISSHPAKYLSFKGTGETPVLQCARLDSNQHPPWCEHGAASRLSYRRNSFTDKHIQWADVDLNHGPFACHANALAN